MSYTQEELKAKIEAMRNEPASGLDALDKARENMHAAREAGIDTRRHFEELSRKNYYLYGLKAAEEERKASEKRQKADAEASAKLQEAEARADFEHRYIAAGGDHASFARAWPSMWEEEIQRRVLSGRDLMREKLLASGRYDALGI